MKFTPTSLSDVILIEPKLFCDDRGYFFESYHQEKFSQNGITTPFVQDNQSLSEKGTLRGLHYQNDPKAQAKLIRVLYGEIFDVAVDIRPQSPTYLRWVGMTLNSTTHQMLYIPAGFAHGFYVLSEKATITYKCSAPYAPELEKTLKWDDPKLNISWPLLPNLAPILSEKDRNASKLG